VAVLFTEFRFRSHAYNFLQNFVEPYLFRGELVDPGVEIVSFHADQFPEGDMAREVSRKYDIPLHDSIAGAMTAGGRDLICDAVLSIAEHGDYPYNELGQKEYPRKRFFDEAVAAMERAGRFVPFFNDKHLSHRWDRAKEMVDVSRHHGFPMMAGSSVPLGQRVPPLELPEDARIEEAVAVHGGGFESYDYHALELLQSFVERRQGGETGVSRVEFLTGEAYQEARRAGRWSLDLADAAMRAETTNRTAMARQPYPNTGTPAAPRAKKASTFEPPRGDHAILVTFKDGTRGTVLRLGSSADRWNLACRLKGETESRATAVFNGPWGNTCLFKALSHAVQSMFQTGRPAYPVERTLIVSGILDAAVHSYAEGRPLDTPHLEFGYEASDASRFREDGASWRIITKDDPQPTTFRPGDAIYVER
jgi:hypothetical protein